MKESEIICLKCGSKCLEDESHAVSGGVNDHRADGVYERPEMRVFVCSTCKFEFDESMIGR